MDLDNKILKYKVKKNKIISKINELINKKNKENKELISKTLNKTKIFHDILNNIIKSDNLSENNLIFLIITGFDSVGKSYLINNLENYFGDSYTKSIINIKSIDEFNILANLFVQQTEKKIIYIETIPDLTEKIYDIIYINSNLKLNNLNNSKNCNQNLNNNFIIYLIPENINIYKNRIINKIFELSKSNNLNNQINQEEDNYLFKIIKKIFPDINLEIISNELINLSGKFPLSDNDFIFLDEVIETSYKKILNLEIESEQINEILIKFKF